MLHKWSLHLNCRMSYTNALFFRFVCFFFSLFLPCFSLSLTGSQTLFITHFTEEKTKRSYMAQDSTEIQVHKGPPYFLLYQLQAASKPRPTQDEQEIHFFSYKKRPCLCRSCGRPRAEMGPEVDGAWSCNHPLPQPFRVTDVTM